MDTAESEPPAGAQPPADPEQLERLRRQLRALSLVNRQLHAQLEGGTIRVAGSAANGSRSSLTVRRAEEGAAWLEHLHLKSAGDPMLVHTPTKGTFVVEAFMRRTVKSGILLNALIRVLGPPKEMNDREVERWSLGPPVEVMEAGTGPAFLVVGGRRLPLRGLPLPYLVSTDDMVLFPEGEELNVAAPRPPAPGRAGRAREMLEREGTVRGGAKIVRRAVRKLASKRKP